MLGSVRTCLHGSTRIHTIRTRRGVANDHHAPACSGASTSSKADTEGSQATCCLPHEPSFYQQKGGAVSENGYCAALEPIGVQKRHFRTKQIAVGIHSDFHLNARKYEMLHYECHITHKKLERT